MQCAGFDYGTSNCSIGVPTGHGVKLLPVEGDASQIPSTLYAPRPEEMFGSRAADVRALDVASQSKADLRFGRAALAAYLADPAAGYFIKSPKSFLGANGLSADMRARFVAVVAAMMRNIKDRAELALDRPVTHVVLGRPVHFQGALGDDEDRQAVAMLEEAAQTVGFRFIEFLFEPMAAAMDYESRLKTEQCVLVLDIGGGTTDCSMVRVGPKRMRGIDRRDDVLGHSGERIGGNDYDQLLALASIMPELGLGDSLRSGLPIPNTYFVDAVTTNDVNAQQRFYSARTRKEVARFEREAIEPKRVRRLVRLQHRRQSYRLVGAAEQGKIALSDGVETLVDLSFLEPGLGCVATRTLMKSSCERLLVHLAGLIDAVVRDAGRSPDVIYLTGGMSGSTIVRDDLRRRMPGVEFVDGDHFASVTQGLALWAQRIFRT